MYLPKGCLDDAVGLCPMLVSAWIAHNGWVIDGSDVLEQLRCDANCALYNIDINGCAFMSESHRTGRKD